MWCSKQEVVRIYACTCNNYYPAPRMREQGVMWSVVSVYICPSVCPMDLPVISEIRSFLALQVCNNRMPRNSSCLEWLRGLRSRYLDRSNPVFNSLSIKCPPRFLFMHMLMFMFVMRFSFVCRNSFWLFGTLFFFIFFPFFLFFLLFHIV